MSPSLHSSAPHCACSLPPLLSPLVEGPESFNKDAQRLGSLELCHRVNLRYLWGHTHTQRRRRVDLAERLVLSWSGDTTDMELKKSISDTERALRSYGAVSETAWTTDKGERHVLQYNVVLPPGDTNYQVNRSVSCSICFTLWKPGEQLALKWLIVTHKGLGCISSAVSVLKGLLVLLHAHYGTGIVRFLNEFGLYHKYSKHSETCGHLRQSELMQNEESRAAMSQYTGPLLLSIGCIAFNLTFGRMFFYGQISERKKSTFIDSFYIVRGFWTNKTVSAQW